LPATGAIGSAISGKTINKKAQKEKPPLDTKRGLSKILA
jgi:hypothetical protein